MTTNYIPKVGETLIAQKPHGTRFRVRVFEVNKDSVRGEYSIADDPEPEWTNHYNEFLISQYIFTPESKQPTPTKDIKNLGRFSVANPDLAIACALWLKQNGEEFSDNLIPWICEQPKTAAIQLAPANKFWYGLTESKTETHFNTFAEFRAWLETPEITFPNVGKHQVTPDKTGILVGCTPVTWELLDEIHAKSIEWRVKNDLMHPCMMPPKV